MKTKRNLIFGAIAFVFAIGSAIASVLVNPIYVREDPNDAGTAKQINQDLCSNSGSATCTVQVLNTFTNPDQLETRTAYSNSGATTVIHNSTSGTITPPTQITVSYDPN